MISAAKDVEKSEPFPQLVGMNTVQPLQKTRWRFLKKLKTELPHNPLILFLGTYLDGLKVESQRGICTPKFTAASFTIARGRNNSDVPWWMNEETKSGLWLQWSISHPKKGVSSETCYNTDELWRHYAKWSQPVTKGKTMVWFLLYEISRIDNFLETQVECWLPGTRGECGASV